ncbi:MAG: IS110 family transposase [Dehalococcoidales bacterium]|nr:IS110 family transposase [Dehalococcoidales bacterium]
MNYVGVDLHKEQSWFVVLDSKGKRLVSKSIANSPKGLKDYFAGMPKPFTLAVESTYNWYFFVDLAEQYAEKVYLANSYELKAFAKRHKKTDKIDAHLIAEVLRKGYLPTVTIPDQETRRVKELLRYRMNLVRERAKNIYQVKNILDKIGQDSSGDFTTYKRLGTIPFDLFSPNYREVIHGYSERIEFLTRRLFQIEKYIKENVKDDEDIINLITIPGIDYFSAALIKTEIIDISRFASFNRLCAYAGLAPRVSQSANKEVHGPLNVNRRKNLQWILIEVVYHFIKALPEKSQRYESIVSRKGVNTAKVALAREMLKIIYHVLKEKRPFYHHVVRSEVSPALYGV